MFRESCHYFENHPIGQIYRYWTDYIRLCKFDEDLSYDDMDTEYVKNSGYNPDIILFGVGSVSNWRYDLFKITWNMDDHAIVEYDGNGGMSYKPTYTPLNQEQKSHVAKLFCTKGWEKEEEYHDIHFKYDVTFDGKKQWSPEYNNISYHTLPWVDYLTFQDYRFIVQFWYNDYIKYMREIKLKRILNES